MKDIFKKIIVFILTKEAQMREGRAGDLGARQVNRFNKSRAPIDVPE